MAIPILEMSALEARSLINNKAMEIEADTCPVASVENINIGELPLRIYRPLGNSSALSVMLMVHGGAWVAGW